MQLIEKIKAFVEAKTDSPAVHHSDYLSNEEVFNMAKEYVNAHTLLDEYLTDKK